MLYSVVALVAAYRRREKVGHLLACIAAEGVGLAKMLGLVFMYLMTVHRLNKVERGKKIDLK